MRRVLLGDLVAAVQVIAATPPQGRARLAAQLIAQADAAHRYMKRFGRAHGAWGTGTLESRARGLCPAPEIGFDLGDTRVLDALAVLAAALPCRARAPYARLRHIAGGHHHGQFQNQTRQSTADQH